MTSTSCNYKLTATKIPKIVNYVSDNPDLPSYAKRSKDTLSCAERIKPGQGEAVLFEGENFDLNKKMYYLKIKKNEQQTKYQCDAALEGNRIFTCTYKNQNSINYTIIKSIAVGPFTKLVLQMPEYSKEFPRTKEPDDNHNPKNIYYATIDNSKKGSLEYILNTNGIQIYSAIVSMKECPIICDDNLIQKNKSCLQSFRKCVKDTAIRGNKDLKNNSSGVVIQNDVFTECGRKYLLCTEEPNKQFNESIDYLNDYSKVCNPLVKNAALEGVSYQTLDRSCQYIGNYRNPKDLNDENDHKYKYPSDPFKYLFYYGTFYNLCAKDGPCENTCGTAAKQTIASQVESTKKALKNWKTKIEEYTTAIAELELRYNKLKSDNDTELTAQEAARLSNEEKIALARANLASEKALAAKTNAQELDKLKNQHQENIFQLENKYTGLMNQLIIDINAKYLEREKQYIGYLNELQNKFDGLYALEETKRKKTAEDYNTARLESEAALKEIYESKEKEINRQITTLNKEFQNKISNMKDDHKDRIDKLLSDSDREMKRINKQIKKEEDDYEDFRKKIQDSIDAINKSSTDFENFYKKEIARLRSELDKNNANNIQTIKATRQKYDEELNNLNQLNDAQKKVLLNDKTTTFENKLDWLKDKKDLLSDDFEKNKKLMEIKYDNVIADQAKLFDSKMNELKTAGENNLKELQGITDKYKSAISETQQSYTKLITDYNIKSEELKNNIKNIQETNDTKFKNLLKENEEKKIRILMDAENETRLQLQKISDNIIKQEKLAKEESYDYNMKIEKILLKFEEDKVKILEENTSKIDDSINKLKEEYIEKIKYYDNQIKQLNNNPLVQESSQIDQDIKKAENKVKETETKLTESKNTTYKVGGVLILDLILAYVAFK